MTGKKRKADPELLALIESIRRKMEGVSEEEVFAILEAADAKRKKASPRRESSTTPAPESRPRRESA